MSMLSKLRTTVSSWNTEQSGYWSDLSLAYDGFYTSRWSELENEWVATRLRFLSEHANSPAILDLGCGTGLGAALAARWTSLERYVGVDISPDMAELTRVRHGVDTYVGAMDELDWVPCATVDAVICLFSAASFVRSPERLFGEVSRVLKPGGSAYISTLGRNFRLGPSEIRFRTRGHHSRATVPARRYRAQHLRDLACSAGLQVEALEGMNSLSGLIEVPLLWPVGCTLSRNLPITSHLLDMRCSKPKGPNDDYLP